MYQKTGRILQTHKLLFFFGCLNHKIHYRWTLEDKRCLHSHPRTIYTRIFSSAFSKSDAKSIKATPDRLCCVYLLWIWKQFHHPFVFVINLQADHCSLHLQDQIRSTAICQTYKLQAYICVLRGICISRMHTHTHTKKKNAPQLATALRFFSNLYIGCVNQVLIFIFCCLPWVIYPKRTLCETIMCIL